MLKDFKEFAFKGNVLDMAIGVIIGAAFGKIVTSLVNDLIMPIISILTGGLNFTDLKYQLQRFEVSYHSCTWRCCRECYNVRLIHPKCS